MPTYTRLTDYPFPVEAVSPPPSVQPKEAPDWLKTSLQDRQRADFENFQGWLEQLRLEDLRRLAQQRGWALKGTRKADIARQIGEYLARPEEIARSLGQLNAEERRILAAIGLVGGFSGQQVADVERIATLGGVFRRANQTQNSMTDLANLGLIVYTNLLEYNPQLAFIPRSLARSFPPLLADIVPHSQDLPAARAAYDILIANPSIFTSSLLQLLVALEETAVPLRPPMPRPTQDRFLNAVRHWDYDPEELHRLDAQKRLPTHGQGLSVPPPQYPLPDDVTPRLAAIVGDETRLEFVYYLLVGVGVLKPGSPVKTWSEVKEKFLRQGEPALRGLLARTYFGLTNWSEVWLLLRNTPTLKLMRNLVSYGYNQSLPGTMMNELTLFRRLVLQALAWLPDNEWIPINEFLELMRRVWPAFGPGFWQTYYRQEPQHGAWYLAQNGLPINKDSQAGWDLAQGMFIRKMLSGPLHWLGLADICQHNGVTTDFRLHGLADLYWDRTEIAADPLPVTSGASTQAAPVKVSGDLIRANPSTLGALGHRLMDRIAKLERAQPFQFEFRLDIGVTHRSFEAGASLTEFEADWESVFGEPMPASIHNRLASWWDNYGRIRLYRDVTIIEFGDDYALAEMKAATSLDKLMIAEISPRLVVIPKDAVQKLTTELEKAGYTPRQAANE